MYPDVVDAGLSEGRRKKVDQAAGTSPDGHWKKSHGNAARIGATTRGSARLVRPIHLRFKRSVREPSV